MEEEKKHQTKMEERRFFFDTQFDKKKEIRARSANVSPLTVATFQQCSIYNEGKTLTVFWDFGTRDTYFGAQPNTI